MGMIDSYASTFPDEALEKQERELKELGIYDDHTVEDTVIIPKKLEPMINKIAQSFREKLYKVNAPADFIHDVQSEFTDLCKLTHAFHNPLTRPVITETAVRDAEAIYSNIFKELFGDDSTTKL